MALIGGHRCWIDITLSNILYTLGRTKNCTCPSVCEIVILANNSHVYQVNQPLSAMSDEIG